MKVKFPQRRDNEADVSSVSPRQSGIRGLLMTVVVSVRHVYGLPLRSYLLIWPQNTLVDEQRKGRFVSC